MHYDTILFDLDGTLIDTNELIKFSFEYTYKQYGYDYTDESIAACNGPPLIETFTKLNPDLAEEMVDTYVKHNHAHHDDFVTLFANVSETLEELKLHGVKLGIVSSKMRGGVIRGLELTNIKHYFDVIVSVCDVTESKPHPESVLKAMNLLKAEPARTLMVGDNYHDIISGKNANASTVGVAWSSKGEAYLQSFQPTYMVKDMKDLLPIIGV